MKRGTESGITKRECNGLRHAMELRRSRTDDAFAKLPAGTVESLLKPENKGKLKVVLLLHVVPGSVMAADVVKLNTDGGVKVGTAKGMSNVTKIDIKASNSVIHVIDAVILPE